MRRETLFRLAVQIVVVALFCTYIYTKWPLFNNVLGGKQGPGLTDGTQQTLAPDAQSVGGSSDFFVDYRLERARGQQIELLRELINNPQADEASRRSAGDRSRSLRCGGSPMPRAVYVELCRAIGGMNHEQRANTACPW